MNASDDLSTSLIGFAESCNSNAQVSAMIRDWDRAMHIRASDLGQDFSLSTISGSVKTAPGAPSAPDLMIESDSETLAQIFYGELSPNEPYNQGSLRIKGPEEDIVRLDFLIAMLWE